MKNNWSMIVALSVIYILLLILNSKTLYAGDDYVYRFAYMRSWPLEHLKVISTFAIPHSMWNHYFWWNGRFVAHSVVQYFMQFDTKVIFNVFNSGIFIVLIFLINKVATIITKHKSSTLIIISIFIFLWFFIPSFGQTVLWVSGSGNYLWMSVVYTSFILANLIDIDMTKFKFVLIILLSFLAGATNENSGPAAILIVILSIVYGFIKTRKIHVYSVISVLFAMLGFYIMLMSPGSQKRGTMHRDWTKISANLNDIYKLSFGNLKWVYLVLIAFIIIGIILKHITVVSLVHIAIFIIGHLAAIYSMALSPDYPERTFFGGIVFLAIAFFISVYNIYDIIPMKSIVIIACIVVFGFSYRDAYSDISNSYNEVASEYETIRIAKSNGDKDVKVKLMSVPKTTYNAYNGTVSLAENHYDWMNQWESKYFGVKTISGYR
ncbi:DUF6056 family protein [Companilactobacillus allii]|nr:DUF6056 family protein [Companilactobacillus allii]USQ69011.1 DUF6056 family protein [Companilactobacillus allii]